MPLMAPTSVTSSPSRTQVIPSDKITSQWKRLQGSLSSRVGIWVSIVLTELLRKSADARVSDLFRGQRSLFLSRCGLRAPRPQKAGDEQTARANIGPVIGKFKR